MRKTLAALALLALTAPALAQSAGDPTTTNPGAAPAQGGMNEGRASSRDDGASNANAARRGTETNGNTNGNNQTRNNGG